MFSKINISVLSFIFLFTLSCNEDKPTEPVNNIPEIQSITASPSSIKVSETTSLSCVATDADGDELTYSWSADEGSFPYGTVGPSVLWKSPTLLGNYEILVKVSDGKEIIESEVNISIEGLSTIISGKVFDRETKEPLVGVEVILDSQMVHTDASGHYQFFNFSKGTYDISVDVENYFLYEGKVILSSDEITFDIAMEYISANISGIVKDSYTGEILTNIKIGLNDEEYISDQNGYFEFLGLVKGAYTIIADDNSYKYPLYNENVLVADKNQNYDILLHNVCAENTTVPYDGKVYNTIQIDDQCWFKENLDVGTMIASYSPEDNQIDNGIIEKYCYDNDTVNCNIYGGLYQWNEAMQYQKDEGAQGICPTGWHIPTLTDMESLRNAVDGSSNNLKAIGEGHDEGVGTNNSGFSALLGGNREHQTGGFNSINNRTRFWISNEYNINWPYMITLRDHDDIIHLDDDYRDRGYHIRCLKN